MAFNHEEFRSLREGATDYLEKLQYSKQTIAIYHVAWNRLTDFMEGRGIAIFNADVADDFAHSFLRNDCSYDDLSSYERQIIQQVNVLTEYQLTGSIKFRRSKLYRTMPRDGGIGDLMREYISQRRGLGISPETLDDYERNFGVFLVFLNENDIHNIEGISVAGCI